MNRTMATDLAKLATKHAQGSIVTTDQVTAAAALAAGQDTILIAPPRITWPTRHTAIATWEVLIAAPAADHTTAWDRLDTLIDSLAVPLDADTAEPIDYRPKQGSAPIPAYLLTITEHYDL